MRDVRTEIFHQRVLDRLPTALIVVDESGTIVYGNDALTRITGWSAAEGVGTAIYEYIHPDDLPWLAEAFVNLADRDSHEPDVVDRPWVPLHFRLLSRFGDVVPVEVIGNGSLHDPHVNGIIYEVRLAHERDIVQRVMAGVASGGDLVDQFDLVLDLVNASTLDIDAAVLRGDPRRSELLAASSPALSAVLERASRAGELDVFESNATSPRFTAVADLASQFGADLTDLGFIDAWHLDVPCLAGDASHRIIGFTEVHHVPAMGVRERLVRASDLLSVILLRRHNEELLDRAAHHDPLTGLANLRGLRRHVGRIAAEDAEVSVLFVDLDSFKTVNDGHGHRRGDLVLSEVADRLSSAIGRNGLAARLGGDEFAVVVAGGTADSVAPRAVAQRILEAIALPFDVGGSVVRLSASVGHVELASATDLDEAIDVADRAMYVAKRSGGGSVREGRADRDV